MPAEIVVEAPPEVPRPTSGDQLVRLVPAIMSVAALAVMVVALVSRTPTTRHPTILAFPIMMLGSLFATAASGRSRRRAVGVDTDRADYFAYLRVLRQTVAEAAESQRVSVYRQHPDPGALWTMIGGPRMWERGSADHEFCSVRVGVGLRPLTTRLVTPPAPPIQRSDPVTVDALRRFLRAHSTIADVPITIRLQAGPITIDGEVERVRGLLRAMICGLAVSHPPDELLISGVVSDRNRVHWDWLKWLPHNQHPRVTDGAGPARMVYPNPQEARSALAGAALPHLVVIVDSDQPVDVGLSHATTLEVGAGGDGMPALLRYRGERETLVRPDHLDSAAALTCARRLAPYRVGDGGWDSRSVVRQGWAQLIGIDDFAAFDPKTLWQDEKNQDHLRVPIGTRLDGEPVELNIKEPAQGGIGPHGLCVGATGSGKSELLRTVALGMMARNSPEVLNLLLVDFKGGATFLDFVSAPHVSAVITNLSDEAPLVARMRDALAGEINRRQQLLRSAGNFVSLAAYDRARRAGAALAALPTLFIVVDEFSELLSQHPDFADMFVAIGRLGRSLGMHLLLASQRLDDGRLRGLEAHLSYRIGLKTLSASESRTVVGTHDAYELPNTPGAGYLRSPTDELTRFHTALVSEPLRLAGDTASHPPLTASVRPFATSVVGSITNRELVESDGAGLLTVLHMVLERLSGHGPAAHQVWLPPLGAPPTLESLLQDADPARGEWAVPIGVVDRPFEQSRTPLTVDVSGAAGNVAVVGAPQAGKSTALCTLIMALAGTHGPHHAQFYCLDFGGGGLSSVRGLPHVGAVANRADRQLVCRMVAECESIVRSRESFFREHGIDSVVTYRRDRAHGCPGSYGEPFGDVFLVIDGWTSLRQEFEAAAESITALAGQGLSFGVHVVLSASRWADIGPSLKDQLGTRIELRLGDPADSELDRKRARQVPCDAPGRGLSRDGKQMLIALPRLDGVDPRRRPGDSVAPPIPLLPERVDYATLIDRVGTELGRRILLGIGESRLQPVTVDFKRQPHLLIVGDNECGKTAALRTLCAEIVRTNCVAEARLFIIDFRRTLLGVVESEHLGGYAISSAAVDVLLPGLLDQLNMRMPTAEVNQPQLQARSGWSGPDIYLVVDDYDLVATSAGNPLLALLEYVPHAQDLGLHLIVARRSGGAARGLFEPLVASLRDLGCMGLMMSGRPDDGVLLGSCRPMPLPPGRAVLVTRTDDEQAIQVAWSAPR
ncbi:type VII secretion protein EccCa [Mycobacterium spongiae]|uniref:Type VII secretion protein EccCa n=1 Tax=Mycobacterium spongiae TaxID=886343 RepID=A0A975PWA3_9MYCO|nr:type VII secretion protein EccCa [Mycobacterium spongiae]QUR66478.1 type VII secretion protein EccCa [Mycobacterium spongiae]